MTTFHQIALSLTCLWLAIVLARFRRSIIALIVGLLTIASFTVLALALGQVTLPQLGIVTPIPLVSTVGFAVAWLALMLLYSPVADRLAARLVEESPNLSAFRAVQQSKLKLIVGILAAWILGGILEELTARGIVLTSIDLLLSRWFTSSISAAVAVCIAAVGAGLMHLYQGPRAVLIITQLSILFGILFVVSGYNLWTVIVCHGLYDSIAFIRFSKKKSRYSGIDGAAKPE